jgi:hypothetical protein
MNERIQELANQAEEVVFYSPSTGKETKQLNLEKFAELIVRELVSKFEVEGNSDYIYHNEANNWGVITIRHFVDGDPKQMCGEEVQAEYTDKICGTGRYRLNEKFVEHLMKEYFGVE